MGNFHCVPESCAKVVYREYKPPVVRWRYSESEPWQEIDGDDYATEQLSGQCSVRYVVEYIAYYGTRPFQRTVTGVFGKIQKFYLLNGKLYVNQGLGGNPDANYARILDGAGPYNDFEILSVTRQDGLPDDCGDCVLTIFKNGEIVHTESSETCPTVEVLDCHLSDEYKEITIDKLPYLSRVEVVPYQYGINFYDGTTQIDIFEIPPECLNIYRNPITAPTPDGTPDNSVELVQYITQICSVPGCPPPEYEVICNCGDTECEECPEGTCAIECDGVVCCYDGQGNLVKSIPIADYYCKSDGRSNSGTLSGETGTDVQDFINSFGGNYNYPRPTQQG